MGWFTSRKSTTESRTDRATTLGLDLNSTRIRATAGRGQRNRTIVLDDPFPELSLAISLENRNPEVGRPGVQLIRRLPHAVCANYLPYLGQPIEWSAGRFSLRAEGAISLVLERLRNQLFGFEQLAIALPAYLINTQVTKLVPLIQKAKLPLNGTVSAPLAVAADRAIQLLHDEPLSQDSKTWIVPMHRNGEPLPAVVVMVDIDEYALSLSLIRVDHQQAQVLSSANYPRLGLKAWMDRILDSVCDRCVRLCRRDPRDSADAEQSLYEQLDASLDLIRDGHKVAVKARAAHWFQDLILQGDDFENFCAPLLKQTVQAVQDLISSASMIEPPRAIWLLHEAGRLPGLRKMLHQHATERTYVSILPSEAIAEAAANLAERWRIGELPRVHLDTQIPLPKINIEVNDLPPPKASPKRV